VKNKRIASLLFFSGVGKNAVRGGKKYSRESAFAWFLFSDVILLRDSGGGVISELQPAGNFAEDLAAIATFHSYIHTRLELRDGLGLQHAYDIFMIAAVHRTFGEQIRHCFS
jgi:hypothetical protein